MKKLFILNLIIMFFVICSAKIVFAEAEMEDIYDFSDIEKVINRNDYNMDFESTMEQLATGESEGIFLNLFKNFFNKLLGELIYNKEIIVKIILMTISLALINNLSIVFKNSQISETGFFIIYCMLVTILISGFMAVSEMVTEALKLLLNFMNALIPSLMLAMSFAGSYTSQGGFCQLILIAITIVERVIIAIILPLVNIYVLLMLVNSLVNEDYVSRFANLIDSFVKWFVKTMFAVFSGLNIIQSMVLPSIDSAKVKGVQKVVGMVKGADALSDVVLGTGNVIKNAIGTTALVFIIIIITVPVVKVLAFSCMYRLTAAVIQPVSDKRVIKAVETMARGASLLYKTVVFCAVMFGVSIAIMCIATNGMR